MSDATLRGLLPTDDPQRFVLEVHEGIVTAGGALQGGAALGVAVTAMARATGRPPVWATGHFLRHAAPDARLDLEVEIGMGGHRVTQARARLADGGQDVMHAVAAFGARELELEHTWASPPEVPAPEHCPPRPELVLGPWEIRRALGRGRDQLDGSLGPGRSATWYRRPEPSGPVTPFELAVVGDCCAAEVSDAVGFHALCNSLDNTLRLARSAESEWILVDGRVADLSRGFAAVSAHLWSQEGTLLAAFSQTLVVRRTEPDGRVIRSTKHFAGRATR